MKTLEEHLAQGTPKKILSLDGGGIRGALTLGLLKKIETILKKKNGDNPDFRLCDYFDLIGGTSTGSIIAASLAVGKSVDEITTLYMDLGGKIFGEKRSWWNPMETMKFLKATYDHKSLQESLQNAFGDITIGSDKIKTGLCIVAKRADTNSVWPIINHPKGAYFNSMIGQNKNIPLWQAVRASSAAPTYFAPQMIDVGLGEQAAFVDGGVSMANNPALTLLMVAALQGFPFHWEMAEDKLEIISLGTGYSVFSKFTNEIDDATILNWASDIPDMLMQDASWQNRVILQWLSHSPVAEQMDGEIGNLHSEFLGGKPLLKYLRYNVPLTKFDLNDMNLGMRWDDKMVKDITDMSAAKNRELLYKIGVVASEKILEKHFD